MARPSLKAQRSEEILDAFEQCVARYGVEGATLEKTAEEAGLQRSLLRHNVGNREDLINALVKRFVEKSNTATDALVLMVSEGTLPKEFIDILFDERYSNPQSVLLAQALIIAAPSYPEISIHLQDWVDHFVKSMVKILKKIHPRAKASQYRDVAVGLMGIYFNAESFTPLGAMAELRRDSRKAALRLIQTIL